MIESRPAEHFKRLYQANADPWNFKTSAYEQAKYRQTLSTLGERRFVSGLEVGCSIGVLTRMLAPRCDALLGVDIVEAPLQAARRLCADQPHVRFRIMRVPAEWPACRFDLMVFSEVLYFLSPADIDRCADAVRSSLLPDATVVLVNWLGQTDDPTPGRDAAERFMRATSGTLAVVRQDLYSKYRLDVLRSVAPAKEALSSR
jgi:2-polyprenyl-3-methyl-5-hydroxy-6-metoxy-1,4-benzoquinol methylase